MLQPDIVQLLLHDREKGSVQFVAEYRDRLYSVALALCHDETEAEDLVLRTLERVIEKIDTYQEQNSFLNWVCVIMLNLYRDSARGKVSQGMVPSGGAAEIEAFMEPSGVEQIVSAVDSGIVRQVLERLPEDMREVLLLHYFMDMPIGKIAKFLALPVGTIKSRLHYARLALAMRLGAKLKKPAVALIAASLFLLAGAAMIVGLSSGASSPGLTATPSVEEGVSGVTTAGGISCTDADRSASMPLNLSITEQGGQKMKRASIFGSYRKLMRGMTAVVLMSLAANGAENDPYIESAGTSGIDTGYHVKPSTRLEVDFALTDADQAAQGRVFSTYHQESGIGCNLYITSSKTWGVGIGSNGENWIGHWVDFPAGSQYYAPVDENRHQVVYDLPNDRLVFATGGVTNWAHATGRTPFTVEAVHSLGLFAWPTTGAAMYDSKSKARIYGLKIYEADELVHDFEPCVIDGLAGFRDSVTGKFITNGGAYATFTAGGDYATYESPYVATPTDNYGDDQDNLYIDTQYNATQNTRCEIDYSVRTALPSGMNGYYLFCGYGSTWYEVSINSGGFVCHNGGGWKTSYSSAISRDVGIRHTAILDNVNDKLCILTAGCTNGTPKDTVSSGHYNTYTIKLAARYELAQDFAPIKIYGFRVYEAGELVRNFTPCSQDGVIGLKDAVTGLFVSYPPAKRHETSRSLEYGGAIAVAADPYIEGSGANGPYIVTDYKPCGTTRAEIDFAQTAFDTAVGHYPFGIHATGTQFSFGVYAFQTTQTYGYNCNDGNPKWHHAGMPTQTLARTTLILDAKNGKYIAAEARGAVTNKVFTISDTRTPTVRSQYFLPLFISRQKTDVSDEDGGGKNPYPAENRMPMKLYSFRLYEDDVLVRDYVPAVKDGVAGLQDRLPGGKFLTPATGSFTYGGVFPVTVGQDSQSISHGKTATLTASAPGAISYRWLKNGEPIVGGENGALTVAWRKGPSSDAYQAIAQFTVGGLTAEGEPSAAATVENLPMGAVFTIR